ncbi:UNVERIFIED_CONTAM: hypothetical protein FKN15_026243 [Acipenser sinensis]
MLLFRLPQKEKEAHRDLSKVLAPLFCSCNPSFFNSASLQCIACGANQTRSSDNWHSFPRQKKILKVAPWKCLYLHSSVYQPISSPGNDSPFRMTVQCTTVDNNGEPNSQAQRKLEKLRESQRALESEAEARRRTKEEAEALGQKAKEKHRSAWNDPDGIVFSNVLYYGNDAGSPAV